MRIGIFGTSGMAREAGDVAWAIGHEPVYIAYDDKELVAAKALGEVILESDLHKVTEAFFVIGIGDGSIRRKIYNRYQDRIPFTNLVHPTASFGRAQKEVVDKCEGLIIAAGARLTSGIELGNHCIINQNATIAHDCIVGDFVHVAPGATISGNVNLGDGCWVGSGAVISQGDNYLKRKVGKNTLIGAGAVVLCDCDPDSVYVGVPAKRIK